MMSTQRLLREALRKITFLRMEGNNNKYRRGENRRQALCSVLHTQGRTEPQPHRMGAVIVPKAQGGWVALLAQSCSAEKWQSQDSSPGRPAPGPLPFPIPLSHVHHMLVGETDTPAPYEQQRLFPACGQRCGLPREGVSRCHVLKVEFTNLLLYGLCFLCLVYTFLSCPKVTTIVSDITF